jgi:hypothetical protein
MSFVKYGSLLDGVFAVYKKQKGEESVAGDNGPTGGVAKEYHRSLDDKQCHERLARNDSDADTALS